MNQLTTYYTLGLGSFLDFLRKHSNPDIGGSDSRKHEPIDFVVEPKEEENYPKNPFIKNPKNSTLKERQIMHVCRAEQKGDELFQFFEDGDRLIAEVYLERGNVGAMGDEDSPFRLRYEHMRLEFPRDIVFPSEKIIPRGRIEIQTEFQKPSSITLRRRDYVTFFHFFQKRANLEKVLPTSLFLSIPEMKYERRPEK